MDAQVVHLIEAVVGFGVIFGGVAYLQHRRFSGKHQARQGLASAHGWTYSENEDGTLWRLRGTERGVDFVADAERPRQDRYGTIGAVRPERTRLSAHLSEPGGLLVTPMKLPTEVLGELGTRLFEVLLGTGVETLVRDGEIVSGLGALADHFEVREVGDGTAERLLTDDVQRALVAQLERRATSRVAILWSEGELQVVTGYALLTAPDVEGFMKMALTVLGAALVR